MLITYHWEVHYVSDNKRSRIKPCGGPIELDTIWGILSRDLGHPEVEQPEGELEISQGPMSHRLRRDEYIRC
jgi:hypothetical protein